MVCDLFGSFAVRFDDCAFEVAFSDEFACVDINYSQCFGLLDYEESPLLSQIFFFTSLVTSGSIE